MRILHSMCTPTARIGYEALAFARPTEAPTMHHLPTMKLGDDLAKALPAGRPAGQGASG